MKFFLINTRPLQPLDVVEKNTPAHRAYLRTQYEAGIMLLSGPRVPRTGGVLIAQADDITAIEKMVAADPFNTTGTMQYEIVEFAPTLWAEQLKPIFE
ncbi:MAG TPA: YciI family protein [Candidatus Kapabacteria bacterium]|nr:YciI family protein [Candidatus Kapabacteria bacterium]